MARDLVSISFRVRLRILATDIAALNPINFFTSLILVNIKATGINIRMGQSGGRAISNVMTELAHPKTDHTSPAGLNMSSNRLALIRWPPVYWS
jgi:hypothetical protein